MGLNHRPRPMPCPTCHRLTILEWAIHRGYWHREPSEDERIVLRAEFTAEECRRLFSRKGLPGGDHVCDLTMTTDTVLGIYGPEWLSRRKRPGLILRWLHERSVGRENLAVCPVCRHMVATWPDIGPVDPGFTQRRWARSLMTRGELEEHPFGICLSDGLATPHECPPPGEGPIDRARERRAEREAERRRDCGEGEGRS